MEETKRPLGPADFAPLLFIVPTLGLASLSFFASALYTSGISSIRYYGRNIYEPWLIGGIVWAAAAAFLVVLFVVEVVLIRRGRTYKMPSVAILAAGMWNFLIGGITVFSNPFGCGFQFKVAPKMWLPHSLYYTALTFGLLLAGITAIKFNSIEGRFAKLAKVMCLLNCILALLAIPWMSLLVCLID